MKLELRQRMFKGAEIRRICASTFGKKVIHSHSWLNWNNWADGILAQSRRKTTCQDESRYWINGDRAIILIAIAMLRREHSHRELTVDEVKDRMPEASKLLEEYVLRFDSEFVIGRDVKEFLEVKGKRRSWTTIRDRIPNFSYKKAYPAALVIAMVS